MLTDEGFRRIALALPDAVEGEHMAHPDFRVHGRIFASLTPERRLGMVKLTPAQQRAVLAGGDTFFPAAGAWGRQGCTHVRLADADRAAVASALRLAWENAMALPARRVRAASSRKGGKRG
jgi:hypothetical protein